MLFGKYTVEIRANRDLNDAEIEEASDALTDLDLAEVLENVVKQQIETRLALAGFTVVVKE